jgi:molecular chaperone GrpE
MSDNTTADTQTQSTEAAPKPETAADQTTSAASAEQAQQQAPASGPSLEEQLAAAKKSAADNHNHYLRALADLENYRKRAMREKDELRQYGASRLLEDLLPVIDNLSLGLNAAKAPNADPKTIVGGVEMVINSLKTALAGHGLKEINPLGQPFDPHQHEAISHMPSPDIAAESVCVVVRSGFTLNGRLLRPATVVVSSGPAPAAEAPAS